uniref:Uncharacterized protein n=1 Tax=Chromera velia CCMP2878 TaxID=1169474 RepID=A0A0K6S998_9ALVE|eukprot:Cvel_7537.t1-p1 / transcript=Cvel_7537.t1 / gene=Cvel_7537 / organism=Chromera_velia_CCMP2878 / gene_product=hypothetical protein / transcript_product=hypothetical protein / location=Cvel_scaffold396:50593-53345(-) / protein_length=184 / sequence_SO=supercontig / SO=protein_coding / is_pseudo=false
MGMGLRVFVVVKDVGYGLAKAGFMYMMMNEIVRLTKKKWGAPTAHGQHDRVMAPKVRCSSYADLVHINSMNVYKLQNYAKRMFPQIRLFKADGQRGRPGEYISKEDFFMRVTAGRREMDKETLQGGTERDSRMAFWKEVGPKTSGFVGDGNSKESGWGVEGRGGEAATWRGGHRRGLSGRAGRE